MSIFAYLSASTMYSTKFKSYWLTSRSFMIFELADFNWKHRNLIFGEIN